MANFKQALDWMEEGKRVRRCYWYKNAFMKTDPKTTCISMKFGACEKLTDPRLRIHDFDSTDWEIYYPEDNWCIYDKVCADISELDDTEPLVEYGEVIKLKEKILKDCEEKGLTGSVFKDILTKRFGV